MDIFDLAIAKKLAGGGGGGGGSSKTVFGTFHSSATLNDIQTISVPYSGNGYPIAFAMSPLDRTTATIPNYSWSVFAFVKKTDKAPNYQGNFSENAAIYYAIYRTQSNSAYNHADGTLYYNTTPGKATDCLKFIDSKTFKIMITGDDYSNQGIAKDLDFGYFVEYSE